MSYLGSWKIDDLLTFYANTTRVDTGAATDADAVPSYRVYEDETSTPILTGSMALLDSANTAGFYSEQITLSAANGLEKGKSYAVYIQATVNSVIGATHHTFQMEAEVDANRINWANVDGPTTTLNLSGTTVKTATDVETDTQDIQARLPAALTAGGNIKADSLALSGDTVAADNAEAFFDGTGYAGTNNVIPLVTLVTTTTTAINVTTVNGLANNTITALAIATDAIDNDAIAGNAVTEIQAGLATAASIAALNNLSVAQVNSEVDTALADVGLTTTITGRIDAAITTRASQTSVDDLPTNAELAVALAAADDAVLTAIGTLPTAIQNADATLSRAVSNVQDTADTTSLAAIILAILESSISGTTWTIRKTGGTTFVVKTLTTDAAATPITGVT